MKNILLAGFALTLILMSCAPTVSTDKTLIAWVELNDLSVTGGSVITLQNGEEYDGIILTGEENPVWTVGSSEPSRTGGAIPATDRPIQLAVVYKGNQVSLYNDGELAHSFTADNVDLLSSNSNVVVFGQTAFYTEKFVFASIDDARIYQQALTVDELNSLEPNESSTIKPYAWWSFENGEMVDHTGTYSYYNIRQTKGTVISDGKLVLDGWRWSIAIRPYVPETPQWPDNPPANWLTYHLTHPGPGIGFPGDPNPAWFYNGRYHLHYIYHNVYGYAYAHVSSTDMVHWKWHPTVLIPPLTGHGMFSGTGFYTNDGQPAMIYHGVGEDKNFISYGLDDNLDNWSEPVPVLPTDADGNLPDGVEYWDPDLWRNGETFYAISGGKNPQLMKSTDLNDWEFMGDLLHENYPTDLGVAKREDISCANMFKIGEKWMLLCISHQLGARYYLGNFKDEKYLPESHHLMNFQRNNWDNVIYFAPESIVAADGRRVMWAWIINGGAPSAVQGLPRELELPDDGILRIKPLKELESLRYGELTMNNINVSSSAVHPLKVVTGDAFELEITFTAPLPDEFGLTMLADENGEEGLTITAGANRNTFSIGAIEPPFELKSGEDLTLRIFIDKNLVEVFANDRQAAAVAHDHIREHPNVSLFTKGADLHISEIKAWKMSSIYTEDTIFQSQ